MDDREYSSTTEYEIQKIRERAARQREAFKRMHGGTIQQTERQESFIDYSYQPGYADPAARSVPEKREAGSSLAVIALILGIVSITFFWMMIFVIPIALAGIIVSVNVFRKGKDKGLGLAGLITSCIGMLFALGLTVFVMTNSEAILDSLSKIEDQIIEEYGEDFYKPSARGPKDMTFSDDLENSLTVTPF